MVKNKPKTVEKTRIKLSPIYEYTFDLKLADGKELKRTFVEDSDVRAWKRASNYVVYNMVTKLVPIRIISATRTKRRLTDAG